ncbi:hypothetical protein RclHR1_00510008 [Rhizophagus clarus]|uniref:Uncharacterized protein n=1 Tax=Rhizophagus clarus TaxID=94130 RepID=A0A2Z6SDT1_9GLOM|nr:hypothetical protein RclHR1_00510008 [Rhizophagus clarus]
MGRSFGTAKLYFIDATADSFIAIRKSTSSGDRFKIEVALKDFNRSIASIPPTLLKSLKTFLPLSFLFRRSLHTHFSDILENYKPEILFNSI